LYSTFERVNVHEKERNINKTSIRKPVEPVAGKRESTVE
jgi:hypothetical protein